MFKPGDKLKEGTVCKVDEAGVWVGRALDPGEGIPVGGEVFTFNHGRAFLHASQGAIAAARLHKAGK
jgi:hypothetical protein